MESRVAGWKGGRMAGWQGITEYHRVSQSTGTAARGASTQPGPAVPSEALTSVAPTQLGLHVSCLLQWLLSLLIMTCKDKECTGHLSDPMLAFHT